MQLYRFPVSHFCEKVHWGLDHVGLGYELVDLTPGAHVITMKRLATPLSSVPVLIPENHPPIQGSGTILDYIQRQASPTSNESGPQIAARGMSEADAQELEAHIDRDIGEAVRLILYAALLPKPKKLVPVWAAGGGILQRAGLWLTYPYMRFAIRRMYRISPENEKKAQRSLDTMVQTLEERLRRSDYLDGHHFSRLDITAASLFAPVVRPRQHPLYEMLKETPPHPILDKKFREGRLWKWTEAMYERHRVR